MSNILIIPAIDLMAGECVRLEQGDPRRKKVYCREPVKMAEKWAAAGAARIHLVDLDGALSGALKNLEAVKAIRQAVPVELELGGGLRAEEVVAEVLELGINYAIVGTRALEDTEFLRRLAERFGEHIILGLDTRAGKVATAGWQETSALTAKEFLDTISSLKFKTVIYTDIARDGMLSGANLQALAELAGTFPRLEFIASGGVAELADVEKLLKLRLPNLKGIIIGKALYEDKISLSAAIKLAAGK